MVSACFLKGPGRKGVEGKFCTWNEVAVGRDLTYSLNKPPSSIGFISIWSSSPASLVSLFIRSSWVHPRKAHGLLKSYQNSTFVCFFCLGTHRHRGCSPTKSGTSSYSIPCFKATKTASTNCIRSWPQYRRPWHALPSKSVHFSPGIQNEGTPGAPRATASAVAVRRASSRPLPLKLASDNLPALAMPLCLATFSKTLGSLISLSSTQYALKRNLVRVGRSSLLME